MKHHISSLLTLLASACIAPAVEDPPPDTDASGSSTSTTDPATTLPPASTTDPDPASTSTSTTADPDASATAGSTTGPGGLGEGEECELQLQECAPGLKCMPYSNDGSGVWNATACFPMDPDPADLGEPCQWIGGLWSGYDNCGWGQVCWGADDEPGECKGLCLTDDPENDEYETWTCEDPLATPIIGCQSCFCTCEVPCYPLDPNCDEGQACVGANEIFECVPDASGDMGAYGDPCEFINVCDPGLVCSNAEAVPNCESDVGCCTPFCDVTQPNTCPGAAEGQMCQPWFEPGTAPRGLERVGVCAVPM